MNPRQEASGDEFPPNSGYALREQQSKKKRKKKKRSGKPEALVAGAYS